MNDDTIYCSVCHITASVHCERCDEDMCDICCFEDEGIILCYECWEERERELQEEDFEEQEA
jgi:hypothetical protein